MIYSLRTNTILLWACCIAWSSTQAQSYKPGYEKSILSNGMNVILCRDTTLPTVSINITYHAGSSRDPKGKSGLASLSGNLLLTGTGEIPTQQYVRLQSEARANTAGLTNVDWTTIYATFDMSYLETILWIESNRIKAGGEYISEQMLNTSIQRILEKKRRARNTQLGDFQETIYHELYPKGYPYYNLTMGDTLELKKIRIADVKKFLKLYYTPANTTMTIGGNIDLQETGRLVRKYFEPLPAGIHPTWDRQKVTLPKPGLSNLILQDALDVSQLHLIFPGAPVADQDAAVLSLIAKALAGSSSARLIQALASNSANVLSVQSYHSAQELDGAFWITISCKTEANLQPIYDQVIAVIRNLQREQFTDDELQRARNLFEMESASSMEQYYGLGGRCDMLNLGNLYTDNPVYFFAQADKLRNTSRFAVSEVAKKYLSPTSLLIVSVVPPGKKHLAVTTK